MGLEKHIAKVMKKTTPYILAAGIAISGLSWYQNAEDSRYVYKNIPVKARMNILSGSRGRIRSLYTCIYNPEKKLAELNAISNEMYQNWKRDTSKQTSALQ